MCQPLALVIILGMTTAAPFPLTQPRATYRWLPLGFLALNLVPTFAGVIRLLGLARDDTSMADHARFAAHSVAMSLHIIGATTFGFLGALQFAPALRRRWPRWHRRLGWGLAPLGLLGALSGMWLALVLPHGEYGSPMLTTMRLLTGAAMSMFIVRAVWTIRQRAFVEHGQWMSRAFAIGLAGGTQALLFLPLTALADEWNPQRHAIVMGCGWAVNMLVAECWIRRGRDSTWHRWIRRGRDSTWHRWIRRRRDGTWHRWIRRGRDSAWHRWIRRGRDSTWHRWIRRGRDGIQSHVPTMRAIVHERYGGPEQLRLMHVARPEPLAGQVRVRVRAASINSMDARLLRAHPFLVRLQLGLLRPKRTILGADLAGVIDAVGPSVTKFSIGDEVFGEAFFADGLGSFAEFVCVSERAIVKKPKDVSFVEAAALPLAYVTALQAVRDCAKVRPGQSVLIYGAGGGVGTALVQLARIYGAHVTAVCGPKSMDLVRSLGAQRIFEATRGPGFAPTGQRFDVIFGVNGYKSLSTYRALLAPGGTYVMVGGHSRQLFEGLLLGKLLIRGEDRRAEVLNLDEELRTSDLAELRSLLLDGKLRVVVDRVVPLEHTAEAFEYMERGHVGGKIVLQP